MSPDSEARPEADDVAACDAEKNQIAAAAEQLHGVDLSLPQRLHVSSLIFEIISNIRRYIVPAVVGIVGAARGANWGAGIAIFVFAISLLATLVRYFTLRYRISGTDLVISEGLLFRRLRSVPIRRIQNVDLTQNPLHRLFGVAEVRIETASGTEPEATLRVLTGSQIEELRAAIFRGVAASPGHPLTEDANAAPIPAASHPWNAPTTTHTFPTHAASPEKQIPEQQIAEAQEKPHVAIPRLVYKISLKELVLAGMASNRGMVLLGIALGFFFQGDFEDRIDIEAWEGVVPATQGPGQLALLIALAFVALMLLLRLLGIGWYILRFFGYQLTEQGDDLRISCGLFTKVSATVPRKRIQLISIHRSLIMRWLHLATIRIETAGGAGSENENAAATVSRRWFLPVVQEAEIGRVIEVLRPGTALAFESSQHDAQPRSLPNSPQAAATSGLQWHGLAPLAERRLLRLGVLFSLLLSLAGWFAWHAWGLLAGLLFLPLAILLARKKARSRKFARTAWGVAYQSGWLTRKLSLSFYDRMQTLSVSQSPFDRRWNMASLSIDTAAAGPADHAIDVSYLDADFAFHQFEELQRLAASHRPKWT
ncbi:MAG: PH domain-containing protein [bacterium]|nr:PH domain-containing protein [bacterium]